MNVTQANEAIHVIRFVERAGIQVDEVGPGRCVLSMPEEPNINHFGTVYAGAIYTLGEVPGGILFFATFDAERFFPLVKSSQIRYRAPGRGRPPPRPTNRGGRGRGRSPPAKARSYPYMYEGRCTWLSP